MAADATLSGLLAGGIYAAVAEINRQDTPNAFDSGTREILPCALVKAETELRIGPFREGVQTPVAVYVYERSGYATIEAALGAAYNVLADAKIGAGTWRVRYESSSSQMIDDGLGCSLGILRVVVIRNRGA